MHRQFVQNKYQLLRSNRFLTNWHFVLPEGDTHVPKRAGDDPVILYYFKAVHLVCVIKGVLCRRRVVKIDLFITTLHFEKGHGVILLHKVPQIQNNRDYWILEPTATKHTQ